MLLRIAKTHDDLSIDRLVYPYLLGSLGDQKAVRFQNAYLHLLFNEEDVRLFSAQPVKFHCGCSRTSVGAMLRLLGSHEVASILEEQGNIEVNCDFCNAQYVFDKVDAEQLFAAEIVVPASKAKH